MKRSFLLLTALLALAWARAESLPFGKGKLTVTALTPASFRIQYEEQEMDPRIRDVQIQGNTLIAAIDGIPVTIVLPPKVVDAYVQGALPIGTLANAVLAKCDQMQDMTQARDRFEEESREVGRGLSQR